MIHKMIRRCTAWLMVLAVVGCANTPSGEPLQELGDTSKGVIATSISYAPGTRTMDAWFFVRKKGDTDKDNYIRLKANPPITTGRGLLALAAPGAGGPRLASDPGRLGRVIAVSLPPGDYELFSWTLYIQAAGAGGYGYISPKEEPPPLPFSVIAGQVTYLGSLHGQTIMGKNVFGMTIPGNGRALITDKLEQDLPYIRSKFPMISTWPVIKADLDGKSWAEPKTAK